MLTRTETTHANVHGHTTWTLTETAPNGNWLRTTVEIVAIFTDGVQAVRHIVTSQGFPPASGSSADVRLRIDPEMTDMPGPAESETINRLFCGHAHNLIAISDRLGYIGRDADYRLEFLVKTKGHGCLPVSA